MGINVGALLGPLICGYLGEDVDWHFGFAAAGVGMVAGVVQYVLGARHLGLAGRPGPEASKPASRLEARRLLLRGLEALAGIFLVVTALESIGAVHLTLVGVLDWTGVLIAALATAFLGYTVLFGELTPEQKGRVGVIAVTFLAASCFWAGFEQAGSSMNLFAERLTDRVIGGWEMPASWLQSVNSIFIIALAPVFSMLWLRLGSRSPSVPAKMALGLIQLGLGFAVLAWASGSATPEHPVSPNWLVATYFFHTTAELCLSPIGLSSTTKLAPPQYAGQMMGIWFMGAALGNLIAGRVAGLMVMLPLPQLFGAVALLTAAAGLVLLAFTRPLTRLMAGVT